MFVRPIPHTVRVGEAGVWFQNQTTRARLGNFNSEGSRQIRKQEEQQDAHWLYHAVHPTFVCPHVRKLGNPGGKWMCDPERLQQQLLMEENLSTTALSSQRQGQPCLIYSVGSKGNVRWERDLYETVLGGRPDVCEIHIFDPQPLSAYQSTANIINNSSESLDVLCDERLVT